MIKKITHLLPVIGVFFLLFKNVQAQTTHTVCSSGCDFTTVSSAISSASSGDTIDIQDASHTESSQIVVDKSLTIQGQGKNATVLKPGLDTGSSGDARAFILVNSSVVLTLKDLTIDGTGRLVYQAIRQRGSGTINNVKFTEIKYNPSTSYQGTAVAAFGTGNVDITNSEFSEIGRIGVLYFGTSITGSSFTGNTYTGKGTGNWLDYAVELGAGANATISNNTISSNTGVATVDGSTSSGIFVTSSGSSSTASITGNTISNNTRGIEVGTSNSDNSSVTVSSNDFSGNTFAITTSNAAVTASNNYWGAADGASGVGPGTGDEVGAGVDACPFYNGPVATGTLTDCPAVFNSTQTTYHTSVQDAIDNASANDVIEIQAASHTESSQIVVDKSLTIQGQGKNATVLKPGLDTGSSGDTRAFILVNSSVVLTLKDLTIDGTGRLVYQAIRHRGSGTINNVKFTEIKYNPSTSYQGTAVAAFGTGNVDITNSEFSEIGRIGVLYFGTSITGSSFTGNTYTGKGAGNWLDYAVELGAGANATISNNTISSNTGVATVDGSTSSGIFVTSSGSSSTASITGNTISNNTRGVEVGTSNSDNSSVTVSSNDFSGNTFAITTSNAAVTASNNYWGAADGASGVGPGTGDEVGAGVDPCPFYDGPVATGTLLGCPPSFENSTPSISNIQTTSVDLSIDLNEAGTAYYVVVPASDAAPTVSNVFNGQANGGSAPTTSANQAFTSGDFSGLMNITGLTTNTYYTIYVVAEDNESTPNQQASVTSLSFTTAGTIIWNGNTDNDWTTATNWTPNTVPGSATDVEVPAGLTNYPTASGAVSVNSVNVASGATLIANNDFTGDITYTRTLGSDNWYLVSFPVTSETIEDLRANNSFATGTQADNIGIASYTPASSVWNYYQSTSTGALTDGLGYSVKLNAAGNLTSTGAMITEDQNIDLTFSGDNFNLLGNPYLSFINGATFLTAETDDLETQTAWLWNQSLSRYETFTPGANPDFKIAPGQGFFIEAKAANTVTFTESLQSHESADTFQRGIARPEITLNITDGEMNASTRVIYDSRATKAFDNGFDGKMFGGVEESFAVYTHLLSNNNGAEYAVQILPDTDYEQMIIPIGIKTEVEKEITFSSASLNLPEGIHLYLEDRLKNKMVRLDEENSAYKVVIEEALHGVGRFYLHTRSAALSANNQTLEDVSVFLSKEGKLRIVGLNTSNASLTIYNTIGKQVLNTNFDSSGNSTITLPKVSTGIYILRLTSETGSLSKKIILE